MKIIVKVLKCAIFALLELMCILTIGFTIDHKEIGIGFVIFLTVCDVLLGVLFYKISKFEQKNKVNKRNTDGEMVRNYHSGNERSEQTQNPVTDAAKQSGRNEITSGSNPSDKSYDLMDGHEFEYYCGNLLRSSGFTQVEVTKGSGDQGIDILAMKDGVKYGIQCKCYSSDIGNKAVQEAFAGKTFYGCHVAAVLTNRYFTRSAKELAERNGVLLWDRDRLETFVNSHQ